MAYSKIASFKVRLDEFSDPIPLMAIITTKSGVDLPYEIYEKDTANLAVADNFDSLDFLDIASHGYFGSGGSATEFDLYIDTTRIADLLQIIVEVVGGSGDKSSLQSITLAGYTLTNLANIVVSGNTDLTTITGIDEAVALSLVNVSNNSMTSAQVNAIVDDVFDMAITNAINNGTLNITGNDAPTGDSLLAYNALVGFGWNSGTPITELRNIYEVQAMGLVFGGNYQLTNNIDATVTETWNNGAGFVPIGNITIPFTGTLDGKGYKIDGLYINRPSSDQVGLFGRNNNILTNIFVNGNVIGNLDVGILIGSEVGIVLTNCGTSGTVQGVNNVGGAIGRAFGNHTNVYSTATVTGTSRVGGIIGQLSQSGVVARTTINCFSYSNLPAFGLLPNISMRTVTGVKQLSSNAAFETLSGNILVGRLCYYDSNTYICKTQHAKSETPPDIDTTNWDLVPTTSIKTLTAAEFRNKTSFVGFNFEEKWTTGQPVGIRAKYSESNTYNTVGYPLLRVFETITRPRLRKRFYK